MAYRQPICRATGCELPIRPERFMCDAHWLLVSPRLRNLLRRHHRPCQEDENNPTEDFVWAAREAVLAAAVEDGIEPNVRRYDRLIERGDLRPAAITSFRGRHVFLSNFFPSPLTWEGLDYPTAEHAFQAAKTLDVRLRKRVRSAKTPARAKARGRTLIIRDDWEDVKTQVMEEIVRAKFADPRLAKKLVATTPRTLIEGNHWNDTTWGATWSEVYWTWFGENRLGKILMRVRRDLRRKEKEE